MKKTSLITSVKKRNGDIQDFTVEKIVQAIQKAMLSVSHSKLDDAESVAEKVITYLESEIDKGTPDVEHIQDVVEKMLMLSQFHEVAKSYILYRKERADLRKRDIFKKRQI